ncbi:hypothetical protein D9M68_930380 [compost metagenome]
MKTAITGLGVTVLIMRIAIWPICTEAPVSNTTTPFWVMAKMMLAISPWFSCVGKPSLA